MADTSGSRMVTRSQRQIKIDEQLGNPSKMKEEILSEENSTDVCDLEGLMDALKLESPLENVQTTGLTNTENICYINSVVQCLKSCTQFSSFITSEWYKTTLDCINTQILEEEESEGKSHDFTRAKLIFAQKLAILIQTMNEQGGLINPVDFTDACRALNPEFANGDQHDAMQFLDETLDSLDEILHQKKILVMRALFMGHSNSLLMDELGGVVSLTKEDFFCLRLPIPKLDTILAPNFSPSKIPVSLARAGLSKKRRFVTLQECIEEFGKQEELDQDGSALSESAQQFRKKKLELISLPKYLFIQLKRFGFDKVKLEPWKNVTHVKFDLTDLDLSKFITGSGKKEGSNKFVYDVIGVIHHYGQTFGGHYIAYCKTNGIWVKYADDNVRNVSNEGTISSQNAYVLLLEKQD